MLTTLYWLKAEGAQRSLLLVAIGLLGISAVVNLLQLTSSVYTMQIYDRVLASRSGSTLLALTILATILVLISGVLEICRSYAMVSANHWLDERWSKPIFHTLFSGGSFVGSQPFRDFEAVRSFWMGPGLITLFDIPFVPVFLVFLFVIHPFFGVLGLFALVTVIGAAIWQAMLSSKGLEEASKANIRSYGFLDAALRNSDVTEAMGMREGVYRRWASDHDAMIAHQGKTSRIAAVFTASIKSTQTLLAGVFAMGLGGLLAIDQAISPGAMIVSGFILARVLAPGLQAVSLWQQGVNALAAYKRLSQFLASSAPEKEAMRLPAPEGRLRIEAISVILPTTKSLILQDVSASLEPGELLAVIGPSAAGKTTFARASLGLIIPNAGVVRLDGANLAQIPRDHIGAHVGYLPQDVELFNGTIAENIARLEEPDPAAVVEAARLAHVHDLILKLPQGYDTVLGSGGLGLSPGQKQRIGLARALYRNPCLIVLDEPDANLDGEGQAALLECLRVLKNKKTTTLIVTHRTALVNEADKVLILNQGRVQAFGPKADVLNSNRAGSRVAPPNLVRTV